MATALLAVTGEDVLARAAWPAGVSRYMRAVKAAAVATHGMDRLAELFAMYGVEVGHEPKEDRNRRGQDQPLEVLCMLTPLTIGDELFKLAKRGHYQVGGVIREWRQISALIRPRIF
jgi:hypothetical protein